MSDETATTSEPGPAAAEFERVQAEDAAIGWEIQTLLAEGRELRKIGATNADLADINAKLEDLYCQRPAPSYLDWLERAAENEKHGWTTLADGSVAKVQPNGKVLSVHGGLSEFTDSDGTVYKQTPDDQRRRAEQHMTAALAFQAQVTSVRLRRTAQRTRTQPLPQPQTRRRGAGRPALRGESRRSSARSGDSGDGGQSEPEQHREPPTRRLCAFCGQSIPADRSARARYCSDQHADRDRQRRKRQRDRERDRRPPTPQPADYWQYWQLTEDDRERLGELVVCRCNGRHIEFEPGECFMCGHWLPSEVLDGARLYAAFFARLGREDRERRGVRS